MTGTTQTPKSGTAPRYGASGNISADIPRTVRCEQCGALAREETRLPGTSGETRVRYECGACRHTQTRQYGETGRAN